MGRIRIVIAEFSANSFNHERPSRQFHIGNALIFLHREEDGWTYFASVDEIPEERPAAPLQLRAYVIATDVFQANTQTPQ